MGLVHTNQYGRSGQKEAMLIALAVIAIYLLISARTTLWDRDEPRFTRAVVEMLESGNYLVPTFNDKLWADKPVLFYWVLCLSALLFGPTDFAFRFPAAIGAALTCLLTFHIGRRLLGVKAGLWAMVVLASTLLILGIGTIATIDAVLLPLLVAIMAVFTDAVIGRGFRIWHIILMGVGLGIAMLAKGPIGVLPIPAMAVTLWLMRKDVPAMVKHLLQLCVVLILGIAIFCAWAIPADRATGGEFLRIFIGRHVFDRALKPMEHHGGNFLLYLPYYPGVVLAGFFPWTLHLPAAVSMSLGGRLGGRYLRALLLGWTVPTFILMTLAATKLPHYIIFIWPALALASASVIAVTEQNALSERDKKWLRGGVWFFGPVAIGGSLILMTGPWFLPVPHLQWPCLSAGLILLAMSILAIRRQLAEKAQAAAAVLLAGMLVFIVPFLTGVLPAVEQMKISPVIARLVNEKTPKDTPVATYKYGEPSLNFYLGRHIEALSAEEAVVNWAKQSAPGVLIIPKDVLTDILKRYEPLPLEEIGSKSGLNFSKGKFLEIIALVRKSENQ